MTYFQCVIVVHSFIHFSVFSLAAVKQKSMSVSPIRVETVAPVSTGSTCLCVNVLLDTADPSVT